MFSEKCLPGLVETMGSREDFDQMGLWRLSPPATPSSGEAAVRYLYRDSSRCRPSIYIPSGSWGEVKGSSRASWPLKITA